MRAAVGRHHSTGLRPPLASSMLPIATPRRAEGGLQVPQHQFGFRFIVEILHLPTWSLGKPRLDAIDSARIPAR